MSEWSVYFLAVEVSFYKQKHTHTQKENPLTKKVNNKLFFKLCDENARHLFKMRLHSLSSFMLLKRCHNLILGYWVDSFWISDKMPFSSFHHLLLLNRKNANIWKKKLQKSYITKYKMNIFIILGYWSSLQLIALCFHVVCQYMCEYLTYSCSESSSVFIKANLQHTAVTLPF